MKDNEFRISTRLADGMVEEDANGCFGEVVNRLKTHQKKIIHNKDMCCCIAV